MVKGKQLIKVKSREGDRTQPEFARSNYFIVWFLSYRFGTQKRTLKSTVNITTMKMQKEFY